MPQTKLNADLAFQLALEFHQLASAVADYRFANWNSLTPGKRKDLEDFEWSLANYSSDFNRMSVIFLLTSPETTAAVTNITQTTANMRQAIDNLATVRKVINLTTAAITLGGAIITGNPGAIIGAVNNAIEAIESE